MISVSTYLILQKHQNIIRGAVCSSLDQIESKGLAGYLQFVGAFLDLSWCFRLTTLVEAGGENTLYSKRMSASSCVYWIEGRKTVKKLFAT